MPICPESGENCQEPCEFAHTLIQTAMDGFNLTQVSQVRGRLSKCDTCINHLEVQVGIREQLAETSQEKAPERLRISISKWVTRVEMKDLKITDFPPDFKRDR